MVVPHQGLVVVPHHLVGCHSGLADNWMVLDSLEVDIQMVDSQEVRHQVAHHSSQAVAHHPVVGSQDSPVVDSQDSPVVGSLGTLGEGLLQRSSCGSAGQSHV